MPSLLGNVRQALTTIVPVHGFWHLSLAWMWFGLSMVVAVAILWAAISRPSRPPPTT